MTRECERCGTALTKPTQRRFCSRGCSIRRYPGAGTGAANPMFNGGLCFNKRLNRWVIVCRDGSLYYYARAVLEAKLGRALGSHEVTHHVNSDPTDDRPENLDVMTRAEHGRHHHTGRTR